MFIFKKNKVTSYRHVETTGLRRLRTSFKPHCLTHPQQRWLLIKKVRIY